MGHYSNLDYNEESVMLQKQVTEMEQQISKLLKALEVIKGEALDVREHHLGDLAREALIEYHGPDYYYPRNKNEKAKT